MPVALTDRQRQQAVEAARAIRALEAGSAPTLSPRLWVGLARNARKHRDRAFAATVLERFGNALPDHPALPSLRSDLER